MRAAIAFLTVGPANFHSRKKIDQRGRDAEQHLVALWPELRRRLGDVVLAFGGGGEQCDSEVHFAPPAISSETMRLTVCGVGTTPGGQFGGAAADVGDRLLDVLLGGGSGGFGSGIGLGSTSGDARRWPRPGRRCARPPASGGRRRCDDEPRPRTVANSASYSATSALAAARVGVGGLVIAADLAVARIHALLQAREEHQAHEDEQHDERAGAPRQLFEFRGDRARTCVLGGRSASAAVCGRWTTTAWPAPVVVTVTVSTVLLRDRGG